MSDYVYEDKKGLLPHGLEIQYHARSDVHSQILARLVVEDLVAHCPVIGEQAAAGQIVFGINYTYSWSNGKSKTLDLAIGTPDRSLDGPGPGEILQARNKRKNEPKRNPSIQIDRLLVCCELKAVMTEHHKSQPRVYSELNDAHTIPHQGGRLIIATGLTTINIAKVFISATNQKDPDKVTYNQHNQPHAAERMVKHLRGLPGRDSPNGIGMDAYCSMVIDADNQGHVSLYTDPPSPQSGEDDNYSTFLGRICELYNLHYSDLSILPPEEGLTVEEALVNVAKAHPFTLTALGQLGVERDLSGAIEIEAILQTIDYTAGNIPINSGEEAD